MFKNRKPAEWHKEDNSGPKLRPDRSIDSSGNPISKPRQISVNNDGDGFSGTLGGFRSGGRSGGKTYDAR
jgi:hypothetical protein